MAQATVKIMNTSWKLHSLFLLAIPNGVAGAVPLGYDWPSFGHPPVLMNLPNQLGMFPGKPLAILTNRVGAGPCSIAPSKPPVAVVPIQPVPVSAAPVPVQPVPAPPPAPAPAPESSPTDKAIADLATKLKAPSPKTISKPSLNLEDRLLQINETLQDLKQKVNQQEIGSLKKQFKNVINGVVNQAVGAAQRLGNPNGGYPIPWQFLQGHQLIPVAPTALGAGIHGISMIPYTPSLGSEAHLNDVRPPEEPVF